MLEKFTRSYRLFLISLLGALFITYVNISYFLWEIGFLDKSEHTAHILFFIFRYIFFVILIWVLLYYNFRKIQTAEFKKRLLTNLWISGIAYLIYVVLSSISYKADCFTGILLFQFFVAWILCTLIGHVFLLYSVTRRKELEIEQLKTENLQSRYDALTSQINPHFFFNSLNGLTSLIRKKNDEVTLAYVNKLSDVFRYILQSGKKGLVTLGEELDFVEGFKYMMEVRFASKLVFKIDVPEDKLTLKIPVLSLLPLIDNVVVHNAIDSEHRMEVGIYLNDRQELVVSNPVFPKLDATHTNGTGLKNLENRFMLLLERKIRIENAGNMYYVYLPLK
jgi:sensor histidine kinase YesM